MAKLHLTLATPSAVDPAPTAIADAADVRDWQRRVRAEVERTGDGAAADSLDHLVDDVAEGRVRVLVQRVHGDLHIGRVLRWTRGLSVVGFDASPSEPHLTGATTLRPAAADVARLLASIAQVAREAARRPEVPVEIARAWYREAREQALWAYRRALAAEDRWDLLDERLLAAFEAAELAHASRGEPAATR
jgi:maltokinase